MKFTSNLFCLGICFDEETVKKTNTKGAWMFTAVSASKLIGGLEGDAGSGYPCSDMTMELRPVYEALNWLINNSSTQHDKFNVTIHTYQLNRRHVRWGVHQLVLMITLSTIRQTNGTSVII